DGGKATDAYVLPVGVAVDDGGDLFISDQGWGIRKVSPDGIISTTPIPNTGYLSSMAVDRGGNLLLSGSICEDDYNCWNLVQKFSPGGNLSTVAGCETCTAFKEGAQAANVDPGYVGGIATDAAGNIFLTNLYLGRVRKIDASGAITTTA